MFGLSAAITCEATKRTDKQRHEILDSMRPEACRWDWGGRNIMHTVNRLCTTNEQNRLVPVRPGMTGSGIRQNYCVYGISGEIHYGMSTRWFRSFSIPSWIRQTQASGFWFQWGYRQGLADEHPRRDHFGLPESARRSSL